jgi:hypothetical protein
MKQLAPGYAHDPDRDFGRALYANTQANGNVAYGGTVTPGQAWTALAYVWAPNTLVEAQLINWAGNGGLRFRVGTNGALSLNNAVDAAQFSPAGTLRLRQWTMLGADFFPNGNIVWHRDAEFVGASVMARTQDWVAGSANSLLPPGWRLGPVLLVPRVLTLDERRAYFYTGALPSDVVPQLHFRLDEGFGGAAAGVVAGAASTAVLTGSSWTPLSANRPRPTSRPWGYSLLCDSLGNGSSAQSVYPNRLFPTDKLALLRGAPVVTIAARMKWLGTVGAGIATNSAFRPLTITHGASDANASGLSIRMDPTVAGELRLTSNGRNNAGNGATTAVSSGNLANWLAWRWAWVAVRYRYLDNAIDLLVNGRRVAIVGGSQINATPAVAATGFHPQAIEGTEQIVVGAYLAAATAGHRVNCLQSDYIVIAGGSDDELRRLAAKGIAPDGTVSRFLLREGGGTTMADEYGSNVLMNITREAALTSSQWRVDVP